MTTHEDPWQDFAACRTADPELFYHPEGERGSDRKRRARQAKAICADCPVLMECRSDALADRESYGTWGGMSEADRDQYWHPSRRAGFHFMDAGPAIREVQSWVATGGTLEGLAAKSGISVKSLYRLGHGVNRLVHPATESAIHAAVQEALDVAV
jgi:WhiB family redox-sensing transcriptional regulator